MSNIVKKIVELTVFNVILSKQSHKIGYKMEVCGKR